MLLLKISIIVLLIYLAGRLAAKAMYWRDAAIPTAYQTFVAGMSVFYLAVLSGITLSAIVKWSHLLIIPGIYLAWKKKLLPQKIAGNSLLIVVLFVLFLVPYFERILFNPLTDFDARSVWFFHAKCIFYEGKLDPGIRAVVHCDYPKMLPALAALSAQHFGLWNEHLPKIALLVFLITALFGFIELEFPAGVWKLTLFVTALLFEPLFISNGYVDGWLAIFTLLGAAFIVNYAVSGKTRDIISALMSLIFIANLKNEGKLLALLTGLTGLCVIFALKPGLLKEAFSAARKYLLLLLTGIVPLIIWHYYRVTWDMKWAIEFSVFDVAFWKRALARLNYNDMKAIYNALIVETDIGKLIVLALMIGAFITIVSAKHRYEGSALRNSWAVFMLPFIVAIIYTGGMFAVYLGTHFDLGWHLQTSAGRVMMPVKLLLLFTPYALLELEDSQWVGERSNIGA